MKDINRNNWSYDNENKLGEFLETADCFDHTTELETALKKTLSESLTFGEHIKRFLFDERKFSAQRKGNSLDYTAIDAKTLSDTIIALFRENKMFCTNPKCRNQLMGSLNPESSSTLKPSYLEKWLLKPAHEIKRDTLFLFAFGLGMDELQTTTFLQDALCTNEFYWKNPTEVTYYWYLKNHLSYHSAYNYLNSLPASGSEDEKLPPGFSGNYKESAENLKSQKDFELYIAQMAKYNKKISLTRTEYFHQNLLNLSALISPVQNSSIEFWRKHLEKLNDMLEYNPNIHYDSKRRELKASLERKLEKYVNLTELTREITFIALGLSDTVSEFDFVSSRISFPYFWTETYLQKRLNNQYEISRQDLLISVYLPHAWEIEFHGHSNEASISSQFEDFSDEASQCLNVCGMGEYYLSNPFEMFLALCLVQKNPYSLFLQLWKKYAPGSSNSTP